MQIIRLPQVQEMTGLSRVTIWRYELAGSFPARVNLGPNAVGWVMAEVENWLLARSRWVIVAPGGRAGGRFGAKPSGPVESQLLAEADAVLGSD